MNCDTYDIGDLPTLRARFYDDSEPPIPANPATIEFKLLSPDGTTSTGTQADATNPAVGVWLWPIPAPFDLPGTWTFRAAGTSVVIAAMEMKIKVRKSSF